MVYYSLMAIAFCADLIIQVLFPPLFEMNQMFFVPNIAFCTMILSVKKLEKVDAYILCMFYGILHNFIYSGGVVLYVFVYIIMCFITRVWTRLMNDSVVENIVLCMTTLFIKEALVFVFLLFTTQTTMSIQQWLTYRIFLTLLVNTLFATFIVFMSYLKDVYLVQKDVKIRKEEKYHWFRSIK